MGEQFDWVVWDMANDTDRTGPSFGPMTKVKADEMVKMGEAAAIPRNYWAQYRPVKV